MSFEVCLFLIIGIVVANVFLWYLRKKYITKSWGNKLFMLLWFIIFIVIAIYLYRFKLFGHLEFVDGLIHQPTRSLTVPHKVEPPHFDSQKQEVWKDAKTEFRHSVENLSKP